MAKRIRCILIGCSLFLITFFVVLYFIITRNSYFPYIYFSTESAKNQWVSDSETVLLEYQDEHFYIYWNDNNIVSFRKDTAFWVVHGVDGTVGTNSIYSATVKGNLYIYGTTKKADAHAVKLVNMGLNEVPTAFFGQRIESVDALFFCIKVPKDTLIGLSSRLVFIDSNHNIISEQLKTESLLEPFLETVDPATQTVNQPEIEELGSLSLSESLLQQFYLAYEKTNEYTLQEYTEGLTMWFLNDFVLLIERKSVTSYGSNEVQTDHYDTAYKLEYTDELLKLKNTAIKHQTD
ncbi:MAG: hypothetical protein IJ333_02445 [Clostridia bacterium]|nr:hypothetical protein [Clostridia bacterium]